MQDMVQVTWWNILIGFMGTIVLGALGSGLWDIAFKRIYEVGTKTTLRVITFGLKTSRDTLYLEAAKGHNDRASLWIIYMIILFALPIVAMRQSFWYASASTDAFQAADQAEAAKPYTDDELKAMSPEQLRILKAKIENVRKATADSENARIENLRTSGRTLAFFENFKWPCMLGFGFLCISNILRTIRISFISRIITDYQQRFTICRPALSEAEQWVIQSRFAQMRSREQYQQIMQELKNAVSGEKIQMPTSVFL